MAFKPTAAGETSPNRPADLVSTLRTAPLYLAFAATGVGVALPGALLPVMLQQWHLKDEQGGLLFLLAWASSSLGALLVRGQLRTVLVMGSLAVAIACIGLAGSGRQAADAWIALYGLGLGLTMTTISLIRQQQTGGRSSEMVRLNLVWAVGACACPSLTIRALSMGNMRPILLGLAACFCLLILWAIFHPQPHLQTAKARADGPWKVFQAIPAGLVVMTFLITGVEASVSGWLATYTHRSSHRLAATIAAPTCLWAGLLLSRLFWSLCEPSSGRGYVRVVRGSLLLILASSILLVASSRSLTVLIASLFLGLGIGPTYPLLLAWALRFRRGGAIFFVAGLGAACLPWLTGIVSTWRGSLQIGLAVPIGAAASLLLLSLVSRLQRWSEHPIDFD